ncbi:MAG: Gfo/Idh/MocA family oxidoreductase [Sphaerochaetaceae bacterium]|nr:Gfo/Idh/MocA family oxidoreductase [Sphaerochaetaceae bacterium]
MKLGLIGCGIITQEAHVPALIRLKDTIEVVALCNHSEGKAITVRDLLGNPNLPIFTSWETMLQKQKDLDAVLIALPIPLNYPVSKACLDAGIAVLCEKPAGANAAEAEKTMESVSSEKPLYMIAENHHFKNSIIKAKEIIESGQIGSLHSVQMNVFSFTEVDSKFNNTHWRQYNEYSGGYLMDGGVHYVHALQQIAGPVTKVMGSTLSINPKLGTNDLGFAILTHENGVVTSFNMALQHACPEDVLKLFCTAGALSVSDNEIQLYSSDGKIQNIKIEKEDSFFLEWQDFYSAFSMNVKASVRQEDVVRDVKVIEGILHSSQEGKEFVI